MRPVSSSPRISVEVKEAMFFMPNSYPLNSAIQVSLLNKRGVFDDVRNVWLRISKQTLRSSPCYNPL